MSANCPVCNTPRTPSGEPNCWCDPGERIVALGKPVPIPQPPSRLGPIRLDQHDIPTVGVTKPSTELPHHATTTQQLVDLVDIVANLELRLTTSTPGVEQIRTKRPVSEGAPVNVTVLHALDDRVKHLGDSMPDYLEEERWQCQHHSHEPAKCPHENDDQGRQGVLPDLWVWARMMEADLMEADPKLPEELPDPVTMATVTSWLVDHHERWGELFPQEAAEFAKDVKRWHNRLRAELGEHDPPTLRHTNLGGCGDVLVQLADGVRYECRGCHKVLTPGEMLSLAKWQADVTLTEAAVALEVPRGTLDRWVSSGWVAPVRTGRPALYALRDIRDVKERLARGEKLTSVLNCVKIGGGQ